MADRINKLGIDQLIPGRFQPRMLFDSRALTELAKSIEKVGLVQPLVVRPVSSGQFEILAGERRWRAAQLAGVHDVDAIIRKGITDAQAAQITITENIQREDLTPIEEALGYAQLRDDFGLTQDEIASDVGKTRPHVAHMLRLLKLEKTIQESLHLGEIEIGHAKVLLSAPEGMQILLARETVSKKLTVRQLEDRVSVWVGEKKTKVEKSPVDPDVERLSYLLTEYLGVSCSVIRKKGQSKVHLSMQFCSLENLSGALERLGNSTGAVLDVHADVSGSGQAKASFSSLDVFQSFLDNIGVSLDV